MSEPKLCKDCKWVRRFMADRLLFMGWRYALCAHPENQIESDGALQLIDGKRRLRDLNFCSIARDREYRCGAAGVHWEPKL